MSQPGKTASADDAARTARHETPPRLVTAVYRVVKACQLYDDTNQAVQELIGPCLEAVAAYCAAYGCETIRVLFWRDVIFVNRRILRATRDTFEIVLQLRSVLDHAGVNEVVLERGVTRDQVGRFARLAAQSLREQDAIRALRDSKAKGISVRRTPGPDEDPSFEASDKPLARLLKSYAASILILQSFHDALIAGQQPAGHEVKRVAQKLVALAEENCPLLVACALSPFPDDARSRRAVSTAVVALAMARQLTADRATLTTVAHSALLADIGRIQVGEEASATEAACATLLAQASMSRFHPPALRRSVAGFEALSTTPKLETIYDGQANPTTIAALIVMASRFSDLRVPTADSSRPKMNWVMQQLEREADSPEAVPIHRLLVAALGFYPPGTYVELDSGEVAVVTSIPSLPIDFARPPVRIMADSSLQPLPKAIELDLARPPAGVQPRLIRRPVMVKGMRDD